MKRIATLLLATVMLIGMIALFAVAATVVTVTDAAVLNIRSGPGQSYDKVGSLTYGTQVTVQNTQTVDGYIWGRIDNGWIRLDFTDYQEESTQLSAPDASGNWMQESGKWYYYRNGQKVTGWLQDANHWYYMDANGVMQTGWVRVSGCWYYMNGSGVMQTGWVWVGGCWYYLNHNGVMQTGWLKLGAASYYLNSSGAMKTGWQQISEKWYYFDASGVMAVGKVKIGNQAQKFDMDGIWLGETQNAFSNDAMDILKLEEGFSVKPYWDYSQWTVGYGTKCPDDMLEYYQTNGIPEADAQILLREHLAKIEDTVDRFSEKYSLTLSQNQYDAVVLFSYNCGTSWCSETTGTFHNAIKNQVTGNDLIRSFALWSNAGGEIKDFLVRRRLCEANMYLNGVYSQTPPENYCFVTYDANGGTTSPKSQGYDALLTAAPYPVPTYSGYIFDGWYTAKSGGTKVTVLDATHNNTTLYAHWVGLPDTPSSPEETGASTVTVTVTNGPVNVRTGPSTDFPRMNIGTVSQNEKLTLTEYALGKVKNTGEIGQWGKFTEYGGGWVCLDYTDYDTVKQQITIGRWEEKDGKKYYYLGIEPQSGWIKYDDQWYYTDSSGAMVTGWVKDGANWYCMRSDGVMATGWLKDGGKWYYLNPSGSMATGWQKANGIWYYFHSSGAMATGWQTVDGHRYYLNPDGSMAIGWLKLDNKWYYLEPGGAMATGWLKDGGKWYYLKPGGAMATGWLKDGGKWYYLNPSGSMATGWLLLGSNWFYLESSGVMVTGQKTIGPVTYNFDANGVWIG